MFVRDVTADGTTKHIKLTFYVVGLFMYSNNEHLQPLSPLLVRKVGPNQQST